jgi:hypothetical protein
MSAGSARAEGSRAHTQELVECAQRAVESLGRALGEPANTLKADADRAERAIAELRDCLILELRQRGEGAAAVQDRRLLEQANVALSLVVGVEHPSGGLAKDLLKQARNVLLDAFPEVASRGREQD